MVAAEACMQDAITLVASEEKMGHVSTVDELLTKMCMYTDSLTLTLIATEWH